MDTNVQALKGLYAALNGDPKDVENMTTSSEVITAMQDVAAAAATELPVVAKKDAGKVLTVNGNGKWSAAMPESVIDDTASSETKTYSSSKIESIIPVIDDVHTSATKLYSSNKVSSLISNLRANFIEGLNLSFVNDFNGGQSSTTLTADQATGATMGNIPMYCQTMIDFKTTTVKFNPVSWVPNEKAEYLAVLRTSNSTKYITFTVTANQAQKVTFSLKEISDPA